VTAKNSTLSNPDLPGGDPFDLEAVAAVYIADDEWDSISNVVATTYPVALYAYELEEGGIANVNATSGWYGVYGDDSYDNVLSGLGMYLDVIGVAIYDGGDNVVTQSSFVDCSSYGVATYFGDENYIYDNNFIGNNGAGSSYSAAHIQAYTGYGAYNYYDFEGIGNYWSDWHTYTQDGSLAPYPLNDLAWDYYPLGGVVGTFGVWFYDEGLTSGTTWSVTFNGQQQTTSNDWLVFYDMPGTYSYTAGAVAGYSIAPASGSVTVTGSSLSEYITYTPQYVVNVTESGLQFTSGVSWSATVGGVTVHSTSTTAAVPVGPGTYQYQISPVAGYTVSPSSGTVTVTNGTYNLYVTFTQVTYLVTVTESGLASGASWSASVNGNTLSSTGTSITFSLPNGTYTIKVANVSGYSLSSGSVSVTVAGTPAGGSVSFSPNTSTSVVSTDTFDTWFAVAIALAVIALVIGLLAVFMRRRNNGPQQSQGAQPWTPPAGQGESAAGGTTSNPGWSEGPPAGGSPPSS